MYEKKRAITIDHTKIGTEDLTNYPLLLSGSFPYLRTLANGGSLISTSGYDHAFYADADLTVPLKYECVAHNLTTGACQFQVKIPSLSHDVDTVIYHAYKNFDITTDQSDRVNVWNSNITGIWHFEGNSNDATANALNGSDQNGITYGSGNSAIGAGQGVYFDRVYPAASPWINLGTSMLTMPEGAFMAGGWIKSPDVTTCDMNIFARYDIYAGVNTKSWQIAVSTLFSAGHPEYIGHLVTATSENGINNFYAEDPEILLNNTWYRIWFVWNGTNEVSIWKNGAKVASVATTGIYRSTSVRTAFGIEAGNATDTLLWDGNFLGAMDEMMFYTGNPSESLIVTDYNNQSMRDAGFYTIGEEASIISITGPFPVFFRS